MLSLSAILHPQVKDLRNAREENSGHFSIEDSTWKLPPDLPCLVDVSRSGFDSRGRYTFTPADRESTLPAFEFDELGMGALSGSTFTGRVSPVPSSAIEPRVSNSTERVSLICSKDASTTLSASKSRTMPL
jgi:hypothetical protein